MADPSKIGKDWTDDELDLIVADHFAMLAADAEWFRDELASRVPHAFARG